ncbi:NAD(P)-binding domain-containing protein [Burkholderia mallei]|uniref:Ketol-acid reductoisomerase n=2 Tax=Burkholderia mallei TaxID=13373 RepID=A0AAX1XD99_BURML|nr:NAD(P)-binding domain-containing protein [Burkholderia mallei]AAU46575.1 putative ketol-acid reductoisomerase [Burkholderia mallei ATCC 23344]ABO03434.1 putative ketol-acid reductoisomerase [Burkholderia mallei NCTC 10247]AIP74555.1 acetohydroxy acid isomeroreductase, catalytic domain protein [Burkholderia mallei]AIS26184.1 acetohydroxy acid isomeroreductase, catalytic domain protein [Burkholderia mallei NCTC 10247]AIW48085.1 ketol-acid reductoisomerase [Burkholderia mallei]
MNDLIYQDEHASLQPLEGLTVTVIGYGIQGRAFAANLRDSGVAVRVGNIDDRYFELARAEGHRVTDIAEAVAHADIVLLLIPDEAHGAVFDVDIAPNLREGALLCVAHGHSLVQGDVRPLAGRDLAMLAPRMYGDPIRRYYLAGQGAPALVDLVETGFQVLVERGFNPKAALLEVYGSGEMGKMMLDGADIGLDEVVALQGSPTCQVGYHRWRGRTLPAAVRELAARVLDQIDSGDFAAYLKEHAANDYAALDEARRAALKRPLNVAHAQVRAAFRFPTEAAGGLYQAAPAGAEPELAR